MDPQACAETTVEMYSNVNAKLIARKLGDIDPVIKAQILSESMKLYMTHIIKESRQSVPYSEEEKKTEPPTPRQVQFAKDLGCDNPESMSKTELSEWIDKHK